MNILITSLVACLKSRSFYFFFLLSFWVFTTGCEKEEIGSKCFPQYEACQGLKKSDDCPEIHVEKGPAYNCQHWYCLSVVTTKKVRSNYCSKSCNSDGDCEGDFICRNLHKNGEFSSLKLCIKKEHFPE